MVPRVMNSPRVQIASAAQIVVAGFASQKTKEADMFKASLCRGLFLLLATVSAIVHGAEADFLDRHQASLSAIKSCRIKTETWGSLRGSSFVKISESQVWKAGVLEKCIDRTLRRMSSDGIFTEVPEENQVQVFEFGEQKVRSIGNWDPEKPAFPVSHLPGRPGAENFALISAAISSRDPTRPTCHTWQSLLIEPAYGWTLPKLAESGATVVSDPEHGGPFAFRITKCEVPSLLDAIFVLNPEHGSLVQSLIFSNGVRAEVEEFLQIDGHVWVPKQVKRTAGILVTLTKVVDVDTTNPPSRSELSVEFPEGCRVDEPEKGQIHLWGKGEPQRTFDSFNTFMSYLTTEARNAGGVQKVGAHEIKKPLPFSWLFTINLVAIVIITILFTVRRAIQK